MIFTFTKVIQTSEVNTNLELTSAFFRGYHGGETMGWALNVLRLVQVFPSREAASTVAPCKTYDFFLAFN